MGLGLSSALGVVESHGGEISFDPSVMPTRFVVMLPVRQVASAKRAA